MKRRTAAVLTAVALALPLAACGAEPADTDLSGVDVEVMDCDAEDRRKKETPDCGRYVNGKYQEWSWVKAKKTKPPAGWSPGREVTSSKPAPKTTSRKATSDKNTVTDGRSRRTTNNRNSGGSTRRR
jgi:hypothetical protein